MDATMADAQYGTARAANSLNATRTAGGRPAENSPVRIPVRDRHQEDADPRPASGASGMRRRGRRDRFLAGVVSATTGLGLLGEGYAMAVAPRHPVVAQVLFF